MTPLVFQRKRYWHQSPLQEQLDLHHLMQQLKQLQADEAPDDHLHNVDEASISKLAKYCNSSNL